MAKDAKKRVQEVAAAAEEQGFQVSRTKGGHYVFRTAEGAWVTNMPATPGNNAGRSVENDVARLRRAGFVDRRKGQRGK